MSYLVLARKYRPQTFAEVIGQEHVTRTLTNAVSSNRVAHAILFSGPRGTGKTTIARILAKAMNCRQGPTPVPCNQCPSCTGITSGHSADVFEIDGASNNSVDQVRELRDNVKYMPSQSFHKIYIIDEVHMLSIAAFNALLKTLEEPPSHVLFFFATTEPHKIPITILSRCQKYDLRRISTAAVAAHLEALCAAESIGIPGESLQLIARETGGSMRDALSLLDQVMACTQGDATHAQVLEILGAFDTSDLFAFSEAAVRGDVPGLLSLLDRLYENGRDMKKLHGDLTVHFRNLVVAKRTKNAEKLIDLPQPAVEELRTQAAEVPAAHLDQMLDLVAREETAVRLSPHPRLAMEMVLIRLARLQPALSIDALIEHLDLLRQDVAKGASVQLREPAAHYEKQLPRDANAPVRPSVPDRQDQGAPPVAAASACVGAVHRNGDGDPQSVWASVLARIADTCPSLAPNLSKSAIVRLTEKTVDIEVNGNSFNLSRVRSKKSMENLDQVFQEVLGRSVRIRLIEKPLACEDRCAFREKEDQVRAEAIGHPLVADCIDVLQGKVVDVKVLRPDAPEREE